MIVLLVLDKYEENESFEGKTTYSILHRHVWFKMQKDRKEKYEACTNSHSIYVIKKGQKTRTEKSLILTGMAFENMN